MLFSNKDLKKLLIPLLLEQFLAVTIGMADTIMVASCGEAAVSGISLVDSINILLINIFSALAAGGAVLVSQYLGMRDRDHAGKAAKQLYYTVFLCSSALMLVCLALRTPLLKLIFGSIDAEVMANAQVYFLLSALSYPFLAMYNASCALLRAEGNSKATLYASTAMNVVNVAGNAITIFGFGWGVFGAGLATLISRMLGALFTQLALKHPGSAIPYPKLLQFEWRSDMVRKILQVGVPNGLEGGMFQFGKLLLLGMVSTFGTVSIAANAVGNSICSFQVIPGSAISLAMVTVVGQCVGAKEYDQAKYYVKKLMMLSFLCMGALNIAMLLMGGLLVKPFNLSAETEVLAMQIITLHGAGCIFFWPMSFTFPNALRAAGDAKYTMIVSALSMVFMRVIFGYIIGSVMGVGVLGIWIAMQMDWWVRITCFVLRWRSGKWKTKALV